MATLPTGVEIRGKRLAIWFMYRGQRCRESLRGWEITPANIKRAANFRALILSEIHLGEFDYAARFPTSKRVEKTVARHKIETFGQLADTWLDNRELELTQNTMRKTRSQMKTLKFIIGPDTDITKINHNDILQYRTALLHGTTFYAKTNRSNKEGRTDGTDGR
ncbi:Domain of uncharacterised function (DUF3596) [Serratia quinivorans]|nr:Domain of uncharacterised function (DUF3596) [Serratia quinivorans]CAI1534291.1 Domain of uncharacterised function (DUF3596) [Serratia quinivorans]